MMRWTNQSGLSFLSHTMLPVGTPHHMTNSFLALLLTFGSLILAADPRRDDYMSFRFDGEGVPGRQAGQDDDSSLEKPQAQAPPQPLLDFKTLQPQKVIEAHANHLFNTTVECARSIGKSFSQMSVSQMKEIQRACLVAINTKLTVHLLGASDVAMINAVRIMHNLVMNKTANFCLVASEVLIRLAGEDTYDTPFGRMKVGSVHNKPKSGIIKENDMPKIFHLYHSRLEAIGSRFVEPQMLLKIAWSDHIKFMAQLGNQKASIIPWKSLAEGLGSIPSLKAYLAQCTLEQLLAMPNNHPAFVESDLGAPYPYSLLANAILFHFNQFRIQQHAPSNDLLTRIAKFWDHLSISKEHRESVRFSIIKLLIDIHMANKKIQNQDMQIQLNRIFSTICGARVFGEIDLELSKLYLVLLHQMTSMPATNFKIGIWTDRLVASIMFDVRIKGLPKPVLLSQALLSIFRDHYEFLKNPTTKQEMIVHLKRWLGDPKLSRADLNICAELAKIMGIETELNDLLKAANDRLAAKPGA